MWAAAVLVTTLAALSAEGTGVAHSRDASIDHEPERGEPERGEPDDDPEAEPLEEDEATEREAPRGETEDRPAQEDEIPEGEAGGEAEASEATGGEGEPEKAEPEPEPDARLRGRVRAIGTTDGLADARLLPKDGSAPIETDDEGEFSSPVPSGKHRFVVRAPGYVDLEVDVDLDANEDLEMEYYLEPSLDDPGYRTVVRADRAVAISSTRLRDAEAHELPGTFGDPFRVVSSLPGAAQVSGLLPYVVIRGAAPGNTGYYLDGARVPTVAHVAIGPSILHPELIESIDFYPAGAPVRLGRYASGIIEGHTRPARRDRVHGELEIRVTDAGALVEVPFSRPGHRDCRRRARELGKPEDEVCPPARGSITLAGRYSHTAAVLNVVQSTAKIDYWDFQARLDHDMGPRARFTAFAYGSYDDLGIRADTGSIQTVVNYNFYRLDNRVVHRLRNGGTGNYAVVLGLDRAQLGELRQNEWRVSPRFDVEVPTRIEGLRAAFGLDQEFQIFRLARGTDTDSASLQNYAILFNNRFVSATGAYFELLFEKNGFEARPGVRTDFYVQAGNSPYAPSARGLTHAIGVDPRLLLRERVGKRWVLKQSVGVYHQPPTFPLPVPALESFGFERGLQRNIQASIGYEVEIVPGRLELQQQVYGGRLDNLQDYDIDGQGGLGGGGGASEVEDVVASVSGWAYGLETKLRLIPDERVFGWASYTLSRSDRIYDIGGAAPSAWDQRHILNVVLGYNFTNALNIGFRLHYNTGRPYTIRDASESQTEALAQHRNNARFPAFFQLDLRVAYNKLWPRWRMQVYLDFVNATYSREVLSCTEGGRTLDDLAFRQALATQIDPHTAIVGCTELGFRYIVPMLGMRARW